MVDRSRIEMLREKVKSAYRPENAYTYSHVIPFKYTGFIDGMAWNGPLLAGCYLVGDMELALYPEGFLNNLILVGKDARNFGPTDEVPDSWKKSEKMPGFSYKVKPQSNAGPMALYYAIKQGACVDPGWVKDPTSHAKLLTRLGWLFGFLPIKQHVNTMFFAYMLLGKKPSSSMKWLAYDNPFYLFLYNKQHETEWPNQAKLKNDKLVKQKKKVELKDREPDSWPAKNYPYKKYVGDEPRGDEEYTPICELASIYLQMSLRGEKY
jgi:hypothetical protein